MSLQFSKNKKIKNDSEEDNLNIIGLRPRTSDYQRIDRNLMSNSQFNKKNDSIKISRGDSLSSSKYC